MIRKFPLVALVFSYLCLAVQGFGADSIKGQVIGGGAPIAKTTVTLWEASPDAPEKIADTKTSDDGRFELRAKETRNDGILYLTANGGVGGIATIFSECGAKAFAESPVVRI